MVWDTALINLITGFFLVVTRISGLFLMSPFFGGHNIPQQAKLGVALALSVVFFSLHGNIVNGPLIVHNLPQFMFMVGQELIIGLVLGFTAELLFTGIRMSGELVSMQMGMSVSAILDPATGAQSPIMGQFYYMLAFFIMLSVNLHHGFLMALDRSFTWIPLASGLPGFGGTMEKFLTIGGEMFAIAVLIAAPVMGILLISEVAIGFVAKVMPQMNIFMVSLPLKLALGFFAIMASLPYTADFLGDRYTLLVKQLMLLFARTAGGA